MSQLTKGDRVVVDPKIAFGTRFEQLREWLELPGGEEVLIVESLGNENPRAQREERYVPSVRVQRPDGTMYSLPAPYLVPYQC